MTNSTEVEPIQEDERISHYLPGKKTFSEEDNIIHFGGFLPRNKSPNTLSVFRTKDLDESKIWLLGFEQLPTLDSIPARGDLKAGQVDFEPLSVVPETSLHILHADILGWPPLSEELERENLAVKLAKRAELRVNPKPNNPNK